MSKTKVVKSIDNEVIKKATTKKVKNIDKEMVKKEESNQLAAKAEKKIKTATKTVATEVNEKITSKSITALNTFSNAVDNNVDEIEQAAVNADDIESSNGKKNRGRIPKKSKNGF